MAVDGSMESFFHTHAKYEGQGWWMVDLLQSVFVTHIKIYGRKERDAMLERQGRFKV